MAPPTPVIRPTTKTAVSRPIPSSAALQLVWVEAKWRGSSSTCPSEASGQSTPRQAEPEDGARPSGPFSALGARRSSCSPATSVQPRPYREGGQQDLAAPISGHEGDELADGARDAHRPSPSRSDENAAFRLRDDIWVRADAPVRQGTEEESEQARFLVGSFTCAGDLHESLTAGKHLTPRAADSVRADPGVLPCGHTANAWRRETVAAPGGVSEGAPRTGERAHLIEAATDLAVEDADYSRASERRDPAVASAHRHVPEWAAAGLQHRQRGCLNSHPTVGASRRRSH